MADDISLKLAVETAGTEGITKLATELDKLAQEGGAAAPEFQKLASELRSIAEQGTAVSELQKVAKAADEMATRFAEADARAGQLKAGLDEQAASVAGNAARINDLKQANIALSAESKVAKAELAALRAEQKASETGVADFAQKQRELTDRINANTKAAADNKVEIGKLSAANKDANAELSKAESAYNKAASAASSLSKKNDEAKVALDGALKKLKEAGIEADTLASAQEQLSAAMSAARAETERQVTAYEQRKNASKQLADAERLLQAQLQLEAELATAAKEAQEKLAAAELAAAEAAKKAAAEKKAAVQAEIAEEDRLLAIIETTRQKQKQAAFDEYRAIQKAAEEAKAVEIRLAEERSARLIQLARDAEQQLANAFKATGVRSISAIQAEIAQVQSSLLTLSRSAQVSAADFDRAWQAGQNRIKELETELRTIPGHVSATAQVTGFLRNQFVQLAAAYSAIELGRKFIDANVQIESLRRSLTLVTGSTEGAAQQIQFLRDTANLSGQSVAELSQTFIKFAASTKESGIPLETMQGVFRGITNAAGQLGISSARTSLMLDALAQMANKGTVSMEELRQQLGDSLPGAISIAAKGLQITESELVKLVETGNLTTREFFPAFQRGLEQTFGNSSKQVEGFMQAWNRLKNSILEAAQGAADSRGWKELANTMDFLAKNVGSVVTVVVDATKAFVAFKAVQIAGEWLGITKATKETTVATAAQTAATEANTAATVANTVAKKANAAAWGEIATGLGTAQKATQGAAQAASTTVGLFGSLTAAAGGLFSRLYALIGGLPGLIISFLFVGKDLGKWIGETAAEWFKFSNGIEDARKRVAAMQKQQEDAARAQKEAAAAVADGWSKVSIQYGKLIKDTEDSVVAKKKLTEAAKVAGDASVALANAIGNESVAREEAVRASEKTLAASQAELKAIQDEVKARNDQIKKLKEYVAENGGLEAANNKVFKEKIEELEKLSKAREAEAERTKANTEAVRLELTQRQIAVETYKDNEARVTELTEALKDAREMQDYMNVQLLLGRTTQESYNAAVQRTTVIEAQLNDAMRDAAAAAERKVAAVQRAAAQTQAAIGVEQARLKTEEAYTQRLIERAKAEEISAMRAGDYTRAVEASIRQKDLEIRVINNAIDAKELEIKVVRAKISASEAEAKAVLAAAEAERAQLIATNGLTEAKKAEIESRIANAKLKQIEAEVGRENIKQIEEEIGALRNKKSVAVDEAYSAEEAKQKEIAAREQNVSAIDNETAALQRKQRVDKEGFVADSSGNRLSLESPTKLSAYNALKSYGLNDLTAQQIAGSLFDSYGNPYDRYGNVQQDRASGETFSVLLQKIAQAELTGAKLWDSRAASQGGSTSSAPSTASSGTPVTINIPGGGTKTVRVASQSDASALVQAFEMAFSRSN